MNTVFEISEINALRFVDHNNHIENYKNQLSFQESTRLNNKSFAQLIKSDDVHRVQIKSNLNTLAVNVYDLCDSETAIATPNLKQKTDNFNKTDQRTGFIGEYELNGVDKRAIWFENGYLPTFLKVGTQVSANATQDGALNGTYYECIKIVFDEDRDAALAIFDVAYSGLDLPRFVAIKYDALDYNIYEFDFDASVLPEGHYFIEVTGSDDAQDYLKISEVLRVSVSHKKTHRIDYRNEKNNAVNFATGIGFTLHLPYDVSAKGTTESENASVTTDDNIYQTDSNVYPMFTYTFEPMPYGMVKKVLLAFAQDSVYVDGVPVIRTESTSEPLGVTNLYRLEVVAKQKSEDFSGGVLVDELGEIAPMLADENGLLLDNDGNAIYLS